MKDLAFLYLFQGWCVSVKLAVYLPLYLIALILTSKPFVNSDGICVFIVKQGSVYDWPLLEFNQGETPWFNEFWS